MELEFELKVHSIKEHRIQYQVLRKGLCVGELTLYEPYESEYAQAKEMNMK